MFYHLTEIGGYLTDLETKIVASNIGYLCARLNYH